MAADDGLGADAAVSEHPLPPRIVTIDDHDVVHAGVEAWCASADPPITVVGGFATPADFFEAVPDYRDTVDVILLDLQIQAEKPDFDTLRTLCDDGRRVVVYSYLSSDEVILTCLDLGAVTYLTKSEGRRHLVDAVRAAHTAEPYVGPRMARAVLHDGTRGRINLSEREREVLIAWFQTESKELVGKRLHIAPTTVRTHLQRARAKYAAVGRPASTKSALLARAIEDGILSLADL